MTTQEPEEIEHDGPVCPSCFAPVEPDFDYCPNCNAPLSQYATVDPIKSIRSEGEMLRRGVRSPRLIVVIGMWIIFAPALIIGYHMVFEGEGTVFGLIVLLVYGAILYKVTTRYFAARHERAQRAQFDDE